MKWNHSPSFFWHCSEVSCHHHSFCFYSSRSINSWRRNLFLIDHKIAKNSDKLEKRKEIGLILFVAIPLPTTGIWTGSAVAAFLGLDFKKSLLCNFIGAVLSATVITIICLLIPGFFAAKTIF